MKSGIRFGIIGLSRVATKSAIPALLNSAHAELGMLGSRDSQKARSAATEYSVPSFGSYDDVLADPTIDAVYISLPNTLHEEWAVKAARAGKHIWCEKPAATSYDAARRMTDAAQENNVRLMEGFAFLFHPQHAKVLSMIDGGEIGHVETFEARFQYPMPDRGNIRLDRALGGGSYLDAAVYPIRASRLIFGEEPISVSCNLTIDAATGVDFEARIELTYSSGRRARLAAKFSDDYQSTYTVTGTSASIKTERAYAVPADRETHLYMERSGTQSTITIPPADQFTMMLDAFCEMISRGDSDTNFERDLLLQARVVEAGLRSHAQRREILLSEVV